VYISRSLGSGRMLELAPAGVTPLASATLGQRGARAMKASKFLRTLTPFHARRGPLRRIAPRPDQSGPGPIDAKIGTPRARLLSERCAANSVPTGSKAFAPIST
jgi:hypothetical protein